MTMGSRRLDVLVVGDTNPDLILRGDVRPRFGQVEQLLDAADLVLGGSAAITATGTARLGLATALVSRVGADQFGDSALAELTAREVDVTAVIRDEETPTGLTVILSERHDRAILTLPGCIPTLRASDVGDELLRQTAHVHVSAYFLQPTLAADLGDLFDRAHAAGCTTSLDTNWDPAEQWLGVRELLTRTDVFLPNIAELLAVAGRSADAELAVQHEAAAELAALGPVVAVKAGAAGAFGVDASGLTSAPGLSLDVVDTTGAGDSFDAGFLSAWLRDLPLEQCLRAAAVAGSLSTLATGGTFAQATPAELTAAMELLA